MKLAIGVISGTSMDGIDVAWIKGDGEVIEHIGAGATYPYSPLLVTRLHAALANEEPRNKHVGRA